MKQAFAALVVLAAMALPLRAQSAGAVIMEEAYSPTGTIHMDGNLFANPFISATTNQATTGAVRLVQGDQICWYIQSTTSNACIDMDSTGQFNIDATTNITGNLNVTGTINTTSISSTGSGSNGIISGGLIYWTGTGYDYIVQQVTYQIGGTTYSASQTSETLAAADPTNPRIDVFYADNTGAIGVITGTPAPNPVEPSINPTTEVFLGFVTVAAGSTTPTGASIADIYIDNAGPPTEWTCAAGTSWNCASTASPYAGTYSIASDGTSATGVVTLTASAAAAINSNNILALELKTTSNWVGKDEFWVTFYNGASAVGNTVFTGSNAYGWDGKAGAYELVLIPLSAFNVNGSNVDSLQIKWNKGGTSATGIPIYIDNVQLEQNSVSGGAGAGGTVTSVGLAGDGVTTNPTVTYSPVTSSGTMQLQPANALPGYFPAGPVAALGSNVAIRQDIIGHANASTTTTVNLSFASPVSSGDYIVVWPGGATALSCSDTLGSSFTTAGGVGSYYAYTHLGSSGMDTVTCSVGIAGGARPVVGLEITGAASLTGSSYSQNGPAYTFSVTPTASTDGILAISDFNYTGCGIGPGNLTINPSATLFDAFIDSTSCAGNVWLYAPGSTSVQSIVLGTTNANSAGMVLAFTSNAAASAAPLAQRRIVEGDLPASAINALQSVQTFNMSSTTIVIDPTTPNTGTSLISGTITMPADGCPCRVLADYNVYWDETGSGATFDFWLSDGTNQFATAERNVVSAAGPGVNATGISPVAYSNSQSVTFTLYGASGAAASGTARKAAANTVATQLSHVTLSVLQSKN